MSHVGKDVGVLSQFQEVCVPKVPRFGNQAGIGRATVVGPVHISHFRDEQFDPKEILKSRAEEDGESGVTC